ncbi:MAG: DUF502 domain-containing protein [Isosphaeraceae bacterium]
MSTTNSPSPPIPSPETEEARFFSFSFQVIRTRIVSGLIAALPLSLTIFIIHYLYVSVVAVLAPIVAAVRRYLSSRDIGDEIANDYIAPVIAVVLVLGFLYTLGLFVRTRLMRAFDAVMVRVPVVGTIFKAVSNVSQALLRQLHGDLGFKRTVLVEFPQPGMKSLAFVTNTLHDAAGGQKILCVCVLTGVMPPSGFTLFVPEEKVIDVNWSVNQTLQAVLSGGITTPPTLPYFGGAGIASREPQARGAAGDDVPASG